MRQLALILAIIAQEKQETKVLDEENGVFVQKPRAEAWRITKGGEGARIYKDALAIVKHRIEDLQIEVFVAKKAANQKWSEFDDMADKLADQLGKKDDKPIPDRKVKKRRSEKANFPGAGGPKGWIVEIEVQDKDKPALIIRQWLFVDKMNDDHLLRISILGPDDVYKKIEKDVNYVLSTLQTFKVKKK